MDRKAVLSEKWIKASIIGTTWAASEIVLGGFLHNLRIPFSGNILTAIGIVILISVSYIWTEKGLFWRAGLICALMKTMSPSAVIFGPMIAIFSESLLFEMSTRLLGRTIPGFILASALAMSWNLFQKIANFIIFYGFNIVEIYANLLTYAERQLRLQFDIVWLPIFVLLAAYIIFGVFAAIIGIKTGRKLLAQRQDAQPVNTTNPMAPFVPGNDTRFRYSIGWLSVNLFLIIGLLAMLNYLDWMYWSASVTAVVIVWAIRYNRALRQLSKPRFWLFFVFITMITAFVFTKLQGEANSLAEGLLTGIRMNFRATVIIVGFAVLGTELYNPRIRAFFLKTSFKQLPLALELSFESLPSIIGSIPGFKSLVKNPVSVIYAMISHAESRFGELSRKTSFQRKVFIITGPSGTGKTSLIKSLIAHLKDGPFRVGGIYSEKIMANDTLEGYDIVDVQSGEREAFLRITAAEKLEKLGRFVIFPGGVERGLLALEKSKDPGIRFVVIDEIGALELKNRGWSDNIREILNEPNKHLIFVIRESALKEVLEKWNFRDYAVITVSGTNNQEVLQEIIGQISK